MEDNKEKRVLRVELDNEVKKVSITGKNSDEKVVMRQELSEDELDLAAGGTTGIGHRVCVKVDDNGQCKQVINVPRGGSSRP